jgi:hypothetical protein
MGKVSPLFQQGDSLRSNSLTKRLHNSCGFPDGPDCTSLGVGDNGLEQFADDGCCLLPIRCGNGDGGERCERVSVGSANNNNNHADGRRGRVNNGN